MRLINVDTFRLEEFLNDGTPPYAILSHTWGRDVDELSFRDVQDGLPDGTQAKERLVKLKGCCSQAKKDGLSYVWIDTCCINKTDAVELGEAINSMFQWYGKASICYVYLSDVPSGQHDPSREPGPKFSSSRWFQRGWTLQELLAPSNLRFYDQSWGLMGTKRQMAEAIEQITGIPRLFLSPWVSLHEASVAQRMSWAANRVTKRKEDVAYSLLGIFGVMMPMIYGEGDRAFLRLQEAIMKEIRDDSILAWGYGKQPKNMKTRKGALAISPADFAACRNIVTRDRTSSALGISGGSLRATLRLQTAEDLPADLSGDCRYGILCCGPDQDPTSFLGIPLIESRHRGSESHANEFSRLSGRPPIILENPPPSPVTVYINTERHFSDFNPKRRRHCFCVEEPVGAHLDLIEVYPSEWWHRENAMISTDRNQWAAARFRSNSIGSQDFVVELKLEPGHDPETPMARWDISTCPRSEMLSNMTTRDDTTKDSASTLDSEGQSHRSASNGLLELSVTVSHERIAEQPMFVVRLKATATPRDVLERRCSNLRTELLEILKKEVLARMKDSKESRPASLDDLTAKRDRLREVEEALKKLMDEKKALEDAIAEQTGDDDQSAGHSRTIRQHRLEQGRRGLEIHRKLVELGAESIGDVWSGPIHPGLFSDQNFDEDFQATQLIILGDMDKTACLLDGAWTTTWYVIQRGNITLRRSLAKDYNLEIKTEDGFTLLHFAAYMGHDEGVRFLIDIGASIEATTDAGRTALNLAARMNQVFVVQLLIDRGANIESADDKGLGPLAIAVSKNNDEIVKLLIARGANLEAKTKSGSTPVLLASSFGHYTSLRLLLDAGANRDAENLAGNTALELAAWFGHETIVKFLLGTGSNVDNWDRLISRADEQEFQSMSKLLRKAKQMIGRDMNGGS